jgi:predicted DsbA family dithiol-disulfide isomerase
VPLNDEDIKALFYILNRKMALSGAQSAAVLGAAILQSLETGKPS